MFSTLGVYHDECGDIMSTLGLFSTLGDIMSTPGVFGTPGVTTSTLGDTKMHVGVIMSTPGGVQYTGGIP